MVARFSVHVEIGPGSHRASYAMGIGSFPGVKRSGRDADHPPHLVPKLKKMYSYTTTPPLGHRGLFYGELYIHIESEKLDGQSIGIFDLYAKTD